MRLPVHIWIREENARSEELAGYLVELARHLDERPQAMRLIVESSVPAAIDFDPSDGNPVAKVRGDAAKLDIRHRWIPEHPVPLELGSESGKPRRTVLLIDPVDGNRFRVRSRCCPAVPRGMYAAFAVVATVTVISLHPVAIAAAALIGLVLIAGQFARGMGRKKLFNQGLRERPQNGIIRTLF